MKVEILSEQEFRFNCASCNTYVSLIAYSLQRDELSVLRCPICTTPINESAAAVTQHKPYLILTIEDGKP